MLCTQYIERLVDDLHNDGYNGHDYYDLLEVTKRLQYIYAIN